MITHETTNSDQELISATGEYVDLTVGVDSDAAPETVTEELIAIALLIRDRRRANRGSSEDAAVEADADPDQGSDSEDPPTCADQAGNQSQDDENEGPPVLTDGGVATGSQDGTAAEDQRNCPTCDESFDSERGLKIHHTKAHGESLPETATCEVCGETFPVQDGPEGRFCSQACVVRDERNQVEITCECCDQSFEVPALHAEQRKYCSGECFVTASNSPQPPSCAACGRTLRFQKQDREYCSQACYAEAHTDNPRPEHHGMLLWLLYVYEDHDFTTTYRRQRAHLGHDDRLTKDQCREVLKALGVFRPNGQLRRAAIEADPDEVGRVIPDGDETWKRFQDLQGGVGDD